MSKLNASNPLPVNEEEYKFDQISMQSSHKQQINPDKSNNLETHNLETTMTEEMKSNFRNVDEYG